jgi:hypothetical protein
VFKRTLPKKDQWSFLLYTHLVSIKCRKFSHQCSYIIRIKTIFIVIIPPAIIPHSIQIWICISSSSVCTYFLFGRSYSSWITYPCNVNIDQEISLQTIYLLLFVPKGRVCLNCVAVPIFFHMSASQLRQLLYWERIFYSRWQNYLSVTASLLEPLHLQICGGQYLDSFLETDDNLKATNSFDPFTTNVGSVVMQICIV